MNSRYKLLITDIDGTIANRDGIISDIDLKALQDIHRSGVMISLCTGRALGGCHEILSTLSIDGYNIFFDGALVTNSGQSKEIYIQPIEEKSLRQVCALAQSNGITIELFSQNHFFINRPNPLADLHGQLIGFKPSIADFNNICGREDIILGCLVTPVSDENRILSLVSGLESSLRFISTMHPARPDIRFINITHKEVSKGNALGILISHLGLKPDNVVAIGDGINDISLLSSAGLAIAMENAPEGLKSIADYITADVDHHGVAQAINHFFR
jgi:Cof subfamily protein (haloacid dehalogenase superfamily)